MLIKGSTVPVKVNHLLSSQYKNAIFNRIDLVIKYLVIECYFGRNDFGYELHDKDLRFEIDRLKRRLGRETGNKITQRIESHALPNFKKLIASMENEYSWHQRRSPIRVNRNYQLCDGSHRLSCAMYFGYEFMTCEICNKEVNYDLSINAHRKSGLFTMAELDCIMKKTKEIIPEINKEDAIVRELEHIFGKEAQGFGQGRFYQSYEPLGIKGMRPTAKRFEKYTLKKYLSDKDVVLDIGCNCGFFSHYLAPYVHSVEGFDNTTSLIEMANLLKLYLKNNTHFTVDTFVNFTPKKYSFVIMAAIHRWLKLSSKQIYRKLLKLISEDGKFFLESTKIEKDNKKMKDPQYHEICRYLKRDFVKLHEDTIKDDGSIKRIFSIWHRM